jgi:DnaJ family protein C protein 19
MVLQPYKYKIYLITMKHEISIQIEFFFHLENFLFEMSGSVIFAGLGMAAMGYFGKVIVKFAPLIAQNIETKISSLPKINFKSIADAKYYKGGFESRMSKREAALILDISQATPKMKIKEAYKRIMLVNHPDKGGSPYIASKLNEGKKNYYYFFFRLKLKFNFFTFKLKIYSKNIEFYYK